MKIVLTLAASLAVAALLAGCGPNFTVINAASQRAETDADWAEKWAEQAQKSADQAQAAAKLAQSRVSQATQSARQANDALADIEGDSADADNAP
jgi:hypothetical protein